jgi:outer membrane protein OmpA-like peptidoglycan-associated protein
MRRFCLLLPAVVGAIYLVAGCSSLSDLSGTGVTATQHCGSPRSMELIIGAHRNAPRPWLDSALVCQVTLAIRAGKPVQIVAVSGQPSLISLRLGSVTGGTIAQQNSPRVQQDVQRVQAAITATRPDSPGVDDLEAISTAADAARSVGQSHAELVLIDSGLDDHGALDFTVPGVLAATPAEVVEQLKASGNLPHLAGFTVLLVGIGYTAPPQAPLSAKWRSSVTQIWVAIMTAAGAKVEVIPQPGQGPSVETDQPVRSVPLPPTLQVKPNTQSPIVLNGESAVRFEPNTIAFADPVAAAKALTPISRWLAADHSRHAWLEGTTADVGPLAGQIQLSRLRANRCRDELIALGASSSQITVTGVGSDFPQFIPDRDAAGTLLAGPATLNRSVRITLK